MNDYVVYIFCFRIQTHPEKTETEFATNDQKRNNQHGKLEGDELSLSGTEDEDDLDVLMQQINNLHSERTGIQ